MDETGLFFPSLYLRFWPKMKFFSDLSSGSSGRAAVLQWHTDLLQDAGTQVQQKTQTTTLTQPYSWINTGCGRILFPPVCRAQKWITQVSHCSHTHSLAQHDCSPTSVHTGCVLVGDEGPCSLSPSLSPLASAEGRHLHACAKLSHPPPPTPLHHLSLSSRTSIAGQDIQHLQGERENEREGEGEGGWSRGRRREHMTQRREREGEIDHSVGERQREAADIDGVNNGALGSREVVVGQTTAEGKDIWGGGLLLSEHRGRRRRRRRMGLEHRLAMALQKLD